MNESGPTRRNVLVATSGALTVAGCTDSTATASGYGTTYGAAYETE